MTNTVSDNTEGHSHSSVLSSRLAKYTGGKDIAVILSRVLVSKCIKLWGYGHHSILELAVHFSRRDKEFSRQAKANKGVQHH